MAATHPDWPRSSRVRVLAARLIHQKTFPTIAAEIPGVTASGASNLVNRFLSRYPNLTAEQLVLEASRSQRAGVVGRKPRVRPGSRESLLIRRAIRAPEATNQVLPRTRSRDFDQPSNDLDPRQVRNIAVSHAHRMADPEGQRPITRKRALEKTSLDRPNLDDRRRYCDYLLSLPDSAILINCDLTTIDFGGSAQKDPRFTHMQWAAACSDTRLPRPHLIWEPETEEDAGALLDRLHSQQAVLDSVVTGYRQKAAEEGSPEWRLLQLKNSEIAAHKSNIRGRKGRKVPMTPERLFPMEEIERDSNKNKGGVDSIFYAFEIYQKLLFPYYRAVQRLNPASRVYIVEDNVGLHHRARRLLAPEIQPGTEHEIRFLERPAFSPDLAPIEQLQDDQKELLRDYRLSIGSSSKAVKDKAAEEARRVWQESPEFNDHVIKRLSTQCFKGLASRSKVADPPCSNRYRESP